jgi:DNA-binding PadR family transcriptional regulator
MFDKKIPELNNVIHSQIRLAIMSILSSAKSADFNYLKASTGATDGNLSTHLSKLEESGFISIEKSFRGKKPLTTINITDSGKEAFLNYLDHLEQILHIHKSGKGK